MKYLLAILLLVLFWMIWIFLPDRRQRWRQSQIDYEFETGSTEPTSTEYISTAAIRKIKDRDKRAAPSSSWRTAVTPGSPYSTRVGSGAALDVSVDPPVAHPARSAEDQAEAPESSISSASTPIASDDSGFLAAPSSGVRSDDLTRIKGIGPVLQGKLHNLGITSFLQIAEFTREDIERVDEVLSFKGRVEREQWVEQARALVAKI